MNYPIVEIEWIDSVGGETGWATVETYLEDLFRDEAMYHLTVGYLIHEDDLKIVVAHNTSKHGEDDGGYGQINMAMGIPKVCILKRRQLTPVKKEKGGAGNSSATRASVRAS